MAGTIENSPLIALRNPVFRRLWCFSLLSSMGVTAHDCAAIWAMYKLNASPVFLSLMSAAAALPFFLFIVPAGALADVVDRRKLLCVTSFWSALSAGLLAALSTLGLLSPGLILLCVFLLGVGLAITAPVWPALASEMVSKEELPSATLLGSLQLNVGVILGPSVGGMLLPLVGAKWVFTLNAVCFLLVAVALLLWKGQVAPSKLPLENFLESFFTAIRYVQHSPGIQIILIRSAVFTFLISLIPAIIPVIGLKEVDLNAIGCGLMFSALSGGSVIAGLILMGWIRAHISPNLLTIVANFLLGTVFVLIAFVRDQTLFILIAFVGGIGWTLCASELWVAAQRAIPDWARARINAVFFMVTQGAIVLGGILWGTAAVTFGSAQTLIGGSILLFLSVIIALPLSINFTRAIDLTPVPVTGFSHKLLYLPKADDGPVVIHYDIQVDRARGHDFLETMKHVRMVYLRNGAFSWRLHEDLGRYNTYRIEIMVPSWSQYLAQTERLTKAEKKLLERARNFHVGDTPPEEQMFLCVNRELHSRRFWKSKAPYPGAGPLNMTAPGAQQAGSSRI
jgi:predicted MFS family arabinose efflux permease